MWRIFERFIKPYIRFLISCLPLVFGTTKSNALTECLVSYKSSPVIQPILVPLDSFLCEAPRTAAPPLPPLWILIINHQAMLQKRRPRPRTNPQLPPPSTDPSPGFILANLRPNRLHLPRPRPKDARLAPENRPLFPSPRDRTECASRDLALHLQRKHQSPRRFGRRLGPTVRRRSRHRGEPDAVLAPAIPRPRRAARG